MKVKTRIKTRHFVDSKGLVGGTKVTSTHVVEVYLNRRWTPLGENGAITRFPKLEDAQKAARELASRDVTVG